MPPAASAESRPAALERLGRYRIVRPLSKGGMALVYEARRESLAGVSPRVAIKLILPEHAASQTYKDLFVNEARLGSSMQHQNLVQIQDFDCDGDTWFLVMEYVEGLTLRRVIGICSRFGIPMPMTVIAELGRQACDGLHYAHHAADDQGQALELVHRDIKPSNLILSPHGVVKVLDFGISKGRLREERTGSVKGTWGYMAPEQASGEDVGPSADVFGLATVLYELAAQQPMFQNRKKEDIRRLLRDDHAARVAATLEPKVYGPLISVLVRALQRDPSARFHSAEDFGRALSGLLVDPITARDELVRFYERLVEVEAGRRPASEEVLRPVEAAAPSEGDESPAAPPSLLLTFGVGALLSAGLLLGTGLLAVTVFTEPQAPAATAAAPPPPADAPPPDPVVDAPTDPPEDPPVDEEPVTVTIVRRQPPEPEPAPEPAVPEPAVDAASADADVAPVPPVADADQGVVYLSSRQPAEIYIGGQYIGDAPLEKLFPPGRYAVAIVAHDGRRKTVSIEVEPGGKVKRVWDFDRMEWR